MEKNAIYSLYYIRLRWGPRERRVHVLRQDTARLARGVKSVAESVDGGNRPMEQSSD